MSGKLPIVNVPNLCYGYFYDLIRVRLRIPQSGPWQLATVAANLLLATRALGGEALAELAGDPAGLSGELQRIGCLACADEPGYEATVCVLKKGHEHALAVATGKADDDGWRLS